MKLSVILTNYNKQMWLPFILMQLKQQITSEVELIIIDDCSTDESDQIITEAIANNKGNIQYIKNNSNKGIGFVRQQGLYATKGLYLSFIDADDFISENYITSILKMIQSFSDIYSFKGCSYPSTNIEDSIFIWNKVYKREWITQNAVCFDTSKQNGEDYEFNKLCDSLEAVRENVNQILYYYNTTSSNSLSR